MQKRDFDVVVVVAVFIVAIVVCSFEYLIRPSYSENVLRIVVDFGFVLFLCFHTLSILFTYSAHNNPFALLARFAVPDLLLLLLFVVTAVVVVGFLSLFGSGSAFQQLRNRAPSTGQVLPGPTW